MVNGYINENICILMKMGLEGIFYPCDFINWFYRFYKDHIYLHGVSKKSKICYSKILSY